MTHGHPDWGVSAPKSTLYSLQDLAELAARLGSIDTYDRRGDVVWMDDFEDNIAKWYAGFAGVGGSFALSSEAARNGAKSGKLICGNTAGGTNYAYRYTPPPVKSKLGFEVSFCLGANLRQISVLVEVIRDGFLWAGEIEYYPQLNKLYYADSALNEIEIDSSLNLTEDLVYFHTAKLVIDLPGEKYARLILDGKTYDLSSYPIFKQASTTAPMGLIQVAAYPDNSANPYTYIDDAIVTQNEP